MNLNEVIFTDGKIVSYLRLPDRIVIEFLHYSGEIIELVLEGGIELEDRDAVGYDFADGKLHEEAGRFRLDLLDDEGVIIFSVGFANGRYYEKVVN